MNNDPISQLPKPYRAALDVLRSSSNLDALLKSVLENAINIVDANWGMIVLNSYSPLSSYSFVVRVLPEMQSQAAEQSGVSMLVYSLACEVLQQKNGRVIPDVTLISPLEKQALLKKHLSPWTFDSLGKSMHAEEPVSLIVAPIYVNQNESGAIVVSRPVSNKSFDAQNLVEVELFVEFIAGYANASVLLDKSTKKHSEFMQFLASEIKNPLVTIRGYTQLLLGFLETEKLTNKQIRFLKIVEQSVERTNKMLNSFVDLAMLEAGWLRFENVKVDIQEMLSVRLEYFKPIFESKNQKVILNVGNETILHADKSRIGEVVEILIRNASSYSPNDSEIRISVEKQDDQLRLSVTDNGIGLTDNEKSHLFQQFYRSDRTEVREHAGIGLELIIAKGLIEKMGGQIGVEGSPNQGSTFWFTLPLKKD